MFCLVYYDQTQSNYLITDIDYQALRIAHVAAARTVSALAVDTIDGA